MIVTIIPRGLTTEQAAAYCGAVSAEEFLSWVERGWMPKPVFGENTYDRLACKLSFDERLRKTGTAPIVSTLEPRPTAVPEQAALTALRPLRLKGINKTKKVLADGTVKFLYYHRYTNTRLPDDPTSPEFAAAVERLNREIEAAKAARSATPHIKVRERPNHQPEPVIAAPVEDVAWLVAKYQDSIKWTELAAKTKEVGRYAVEAIVSRFGHMLLTEVTAMGSRGIFIGWRDEIAKRSKRAADAHMSRLACIFAFGVEREVLSRNPCLRPGKLYKVDRSDHLWLPEHIRQFNIVAKESLRDAVMLALHTGQRQGDILALRWSNFDGKIITLTQSKSRRRVLVPATKALLPTMSKLRAQYETRRLAAGRKPACDQILTNDGVPWTREAFKQAWERAYDASGITADLHFHDLRGTAITIMTEAGCTLQEVATISGHSLNTAGKIMESYTARSPIVSMNAIAKRDAYEAGENGRVGDG